MRRDKAWSPRLKQSFFKTLAQLRLRLSEREALPQLILLAVIVGLLSGGIIIGFRVAISALEQTLLGGSGTLGFSNLPVWARFTLPLAGAGLLYFLFRKGETVGVVHVMERLAYHQGRLPLTNAIKQFFGACIAIVTGHSVGREGPSAHLGAAAASLAGQQLRLPNATIRTLVGSGVAAAIAASFNTPLAGVIFAVEVVLLEYTVLSMAPVITAAVSAAWFTHIAYEAENVFAVDPLHWTSNWEVPYLLALGLIVGLLASAFNETVERITRGSRDQSMLTRFLLAGLIIGSVGTVIPEVMGMGYSLLSDSLNGQLALLFCVSIVVIKLLVTASAVGLGLPGGLIGPTLVIGALAGHAMGVAGNMLMPELAGPPAFYALLGMAAMMGAVLQAPLAALLAILELTSNPNVILPGMMVVIAAMMTSRQLFKKQSIFTSLLQLRGLDYRHDPLSQHRRSVSVASIMSRAFRVSGPELNIEKACEWRTKQPDWVVLSGNTTLLVAAADVWRQLDALDEAAKAAEDASPDAIVASDYNSVYEPVIETLNLKEIPATREEAVRLPYYSSVQDALDQIDNVQAEAIVIVAPQFAGSEEIIGVITREMIRASYR